MVMSECTLLTLATSNLNSESLFIMFAHAHSANISYLQETPPRAHILLGKDGFDSLPFWPRSFVARRAPRHGSVRSGM